MRKMLFSIVLLFFVALGNAQNPAIITGKIKDFDSNKTHLITKDAANMFAPDKQLHANTDGTFRLELDLQKPTRYYILMDDPHTGLMFYVQPGMKADMQISFRTVQEPSGDRVVCDVDYKGMCKDEYEFVQKHNPYDAQNEVISQFYGKDVKLKFKDFRDTLRTHVDKHEAMFAKVGSKTFREYMKEDYEAKFQNALCWFTELSDGTRDVDYDAFMKTIPYQTDSQAAYSYASYFMKFSTPADSDKVVYLFNHLNTIYKDKSMAKSIADQFALGYITKAPENIEDIYKAYLAAVGEPSANIKEAYEANIKNVKGKKGINFKMNDINGKEIQFADLRGKAVYFDMWATWCGPCKQEIPYMAKLAEHYKGSDKIQIISVSLDEKVDAWKKMITKDKPQWPQFIMPDNFNSELCKTYTIQGIPRFMMFDKNGNVISIDAPRPSDPNIINWIDGNLK